MGRLLLVCAKAVTSFSRGLHHPELEIIGKRDKVDIRRCPVKTFLAILFVIVFCPDTVFAQWHHHGGYGGWYGGGWSGSLMRPFVPIVMPQPRVFVQQPTYVQTYAPLMPTFVQTIVPASAYVVTQPIPPSTFRIDTSVTICQPSGEREVCGYVGRLDPTQQPVDWNLLLLIATQRRWGQGFTVVAHFTRHANGTIDAQVTADPLDARYNRESFRGTGSCTAEAMQSILDQATSLSSTQLIVH